MRCNKDEPQVRNGSQTRKSARLNGMSVLPSTADVEGASAVSATIETKIRRRSYGRREVYLMQLRDPGWRDSGPVSPRSPRASVGQRRGIADGTVDRGSVPRKTAPENSKNKNSKMKKRNGGKTDLEKRVPPEKQAAFEGGGGPDKYTDVALTCGPRPVRRLPCGSGGRGRCDARGGGGGATTVRFSVAGDTSLRLAFANDIRAPAR